MEQPSSPREMGLRRLTLGAIAAGLVIRLLIAALAPLLPDEAYYWEWSRHLAAGYFDHPPAVAWLIAAGTALLGPTLLGVRLGTLVVGTGAVVCTVATARRIGGSEAGRWTAVFLLCMPLAAVGLAIATTDAPALFAIAAALFSITVALEQPAGSAAATRWWTIAGIALGCGLLARLTVGIVGAATGMMLLARPSLRRQLRSAGPWLAVLAAALVATPVIWWNAHHGWISLRFQLSHGLGAPARGTIVSRELTLVGGQLGLVSPGIFLLGAVAAGSALRGRGADRTRRASDATFLLAGVGTLVFAFFVYSAVRRPVEPNWPAPAFLALMPVLAASGAATRRWWWPAAASGGALVALALVQIATPALPIPARHDPVARAYGWPTLAGAADSTRRVVAASSRTTTWLAADRYQDAAELAFSTASHPQVFALNLGGRRNQYELWPSFARSARIGDALVVAVGPGGSETTVVRELRPHFARETRGGTAALTRDGDTVSVRTLLVFTGWRGSWPANSPGGP